MTAGDIGTVTATDEFTDAWRQWHRRHEQTRADGHGFLAITGLHWLDATPRRFPDAPGAWSTGPDGVTVDLDAGEELIVAGAQVHGRYVPFDVPRPTTVGAVVEGLQHVYDAPGRIDFVLDGQALSLTAFNGHTPGSLSVLFTDATSGVTTYAANRSLSIDGPAADGTVTLDFNRATHLPCAYTEFATCPLPPAENRLPVAIEAGEKRPVPPAG